MSKPSYLGANVEISTHTFSHLIGRTNQIIYDLGTVVLTSAQVAQPNTSNGALTSGNAALDGSFQSTVVTVTGSLRGGTVSVPATLTISSNTVFTGLDNLFENNVRLGNGVTDVISITGRVNTNIIPVSTSSSDIGSPSLRWRDSYFRYTSTERVTDVERVIGADNANLYVHSTSSNTTSKSIIVRHTTRDNANTVINTDSVLFDVNGIRPFFDNVGSLGAATHRWSQIWSAAANVSGDAYLGGTVTTGNTITSISASPSLFGSSTTSVSIGISAPTIELGGGTNPTINIGRTNAANVVLNGRGTALILNTSNNAAGTSISIGDGPWLGTLNLARPGARVRVLANTEASSLTSAGTIFDGGVSIAKRLFVGGNTSFGSAIAVTGDASVSGAVTGASASFSGNATVNGDLTVNGNLVLTNSEISLTVSQSYQNDTTIYRTLNVSGVLTSNIIPETAGTYDLGSSERPWRSTFSNDIRIKSVGAGYTIFRNTNAFAANTVVSLPDGNVTLRNGSVMVSTDKITDLSTSTASELRSKITGTSGTGNLLFASTPIISSPTFTTDITIRNGTTTTRNAVIVNPAVANTILNLPSANGTIARIEDIGDATLTVAGGTGLSGTGSITMNSGTNVDITLSNSDRGSSQNIFKNIADSAGTISFSAGSNSDTIRFEAGTGLTLSLAASTKTIKFTSNLTSAANSGITIVNGSSISVDSTVVRTTRSVLSGDGLSGGSTLSGDVTLKVDASVVRTSRSISTGWGLTGGGDFSTNRNFEVNTTNLDERYAIKTVVLSGGDGISNTIGDISASRSISVDSTVARRNAVNIFTNTITAANSVSVRSDTNAHFWIRNPDDSVRALWYAGANSNMTYFRSYSIDSSTYGEMSLSADGRVAATSFAGNGANLTALPASQLTGSIDIARSPSTIARANTTWTAGNGLTGGGVIGTAGSFTVGAGNGITVGANNVSVNAGNGLTANASGLHIVTGNGLTANTSQVYIVAGDGIDVTTTGVKVDTTVVRTAGVQSIAGAKTFTSTVNATQFNSTSTGNAFVGNPEDSAFRPSFVWSGSPGTGMWRNSLGNIGFSVNGVTDAYITQSGFHGVGSSLTNLNASQLSSGSVPQARLGNVAAFISDMNIGSLGTYAFLSTGGTGAFEPGSTRSGSNLYYSSAAGRVDHPGQFGASSPGGNWRLHGVASSYSSGDGRMSSLWVRYQ